MFHVLLWYSTFPGVPPLFYHYLSPLLAVGGWGRGLCEGGGFLTSVFVACWWWWGGGFMMMRVVSFLHSSSAPGKSVLVLAVDRHAPASNKSPDNNLRVVFNTDVISGDYLAQLSFAAGCFFLFSTE